MRRHPVSLFIAEWLTRLRWPFFALAVLAAAASYWMPGELQFDRSIANMLSRDDPLLPPYRRLNRTFAASEIALVAYVDEELMTPEGISRVRQLRDRLAKVPGVDSVQSLVDTLLGEKIVYQENALVEKTIKLMEGYTIGADRQTTAVACFLTSEDDNSSRSKTIAELRRIVREHDPTGVVAGEPVMVVDGFEMLSRDGDRLTLWSRILLVLTILLCFRSVRWVIIPMAIVQATLLWTNAVLVKANFRLSMVSSMLTAVVTVVSIATVIHVIVRFREARLAGRDSRAALLWAGSLLAAPIAWACATDAVGFCSLLVTQVGPVQDFGLMMAIGALMVLLSVAMILPALALIGPFDDDPRWAWGEGKLGVGLQRLAAALDRWPRTLGALIVATGVLAIAGSFRLKVETDFTKNFRRDSEIVTSYNFIESRLGGAGVWDVLIPVNDPDDPKFLARVRRLQERLRTEVPYVDNQGSESLGLPKVMSLVDVWDLALDLAPKLPFVNYDRVTLNTALSGLQTAAPDVLPAFYGVDPKNKKPYLRIMLRSHEQQPARDKQRTIEAVRRITKEEFPDDEFPEESSKTEVTGFFILLSHLINSLVRDQWIAFGVASAGIGLMMLLAFRSLRYALVALVPNALPILVVSGVMGWLGLRINMGAAMIAAVSIGLSVDSSIHYIAAFRRALEDGLSVVDAIDTVHQSVGRAMVFSTLALVVGFSVLCLSDFVPTIYFGALVSLSMLGGLAGNLVVLPLLLRWVSRG
jgi:predicted RND superfamily exporter protein